VALLDLRLTHPTVTQGVPTPRLGTPCIVGAQLVISFARWHDMQRQSVTENFCHYHRVAGSFVK